MQGLLIAFIELPSAIAALRALPRDEHRAAPTVAHLFFELGILVSLVLEHPPHQLLLVVFLDFLESLCAEHGSTTLRELVSILVDFGGERRPDVVAHSSLLVLWRLGYKGQFSCNAYAHNSLLVIRWRLSKVRPGRCGIPRPVLTPNRGVVVQKLVLPLLRLLVLLLGLRGCLQRHDRGLFKAD